jgi:chromosome segregation ATPase/CheY-like chemotaxis protein
MALFGNAAQRLGKLKRGPNPNDARAEHLTAALREIEQRATSPEDAVEPALDVLLEASEAAGGAICLFDQRQQVLRLAAERGLSDEGCRSLRHVRRGLVGAWDMPLQSLINRRAYLIQNASQNRYVPPLIEDAKAMRTVACLPLFTGTTPVGSLILVATTTTALSDDQLTALDRPMKLLVRIIESIRARATRRPVDTPDEPPPMLNRDRRAGEEVITAHDGMTPADLADSAHLEPSERSTGTSTGRKLKQARDEAQRYQEHARDWERKHQELAGELAAAAAREQRLRHDLTTAAAQLQDLSSSPDGSATKDSAAQLAQTARLQASLAEAEAIAARERIRSSETDQKLKDLTRLLQEATAREQEIRAQFDGVGGTSEATGRPLNEPAEIARLRAKLTDLHATLAAERSRVATLEQTHEDLAARLGEAQDAERQYREGFESLAAEFEARTHELRTDHESDRTRSSARIAELEETVRTRATQVERLEQQHLTISQELAATAARERQLNDELAAANEDSQRRLAEAEETLRRLEEAGAADAERLEAKLAAAQGSAEAERERATALEVGRQEQNAQLLSAQSEVQQLRAQLTTTNDEHAERVTDFEAALERARQESAAWKHKHEDLEQELRAAIDRERERLSQALKREEDAAARAARAEEQSTREEARAEERAAELTELGDRLAELEMAAARETDRAREWEKRYEETRTTLDAHLSERAALEQRLSSLRANVQNRSSDGAVREAELVAQIETFAARLTDTEGKLSRTEQTASDLAERHERQAADLAAARARADTTGQQLQTLRSETAQQRVQAEGARAAAVAEGESRRSLLAEAQQRAESLEQQLEQTRQQVEMLERREGELRREVEGRTRELERLRERQTDEKTRLESVQADARALLDERARVAELQAQVEALRTAAITADEGAAEDGSDDLDETLLDDLADALTSSDAADLPKDDAQTSGLAARSESPVGAEPAAAVTETTGTDPAPAPSSPSAATGAPVAIKARPTVAAKFREGPVQRVVVIDSNPRWADTTLHGVEVLQVAPHANAYGAIAKADADRALVNLAVPDVLETMAACRENGVTVPFCGCLADPDGERGLALGFVELVPGPVDPDDVLVALQTYGPRGTRVLTAGGDADAFISLRQALSRQGMSVSMAWDGKQAQDLLSMVQPEVVVVDLDLPPKGGLHLIVSLLDGERVPMVVAIPGKKNFATSVAAFLKSPVMTNRLATLDRLLDRVRTSALPKRG